MAASRLVIWDFERRPGQRARDAACLKLHEDIAVGTLSLTSSKPRAARCRNTMPPDFTARAAFTEDSKRRRCRADAEPLRARAEAAGHAGAASGHLSTLPYWAPPGPGFPGYRLVAAGTPSASFRSGATFRGVDLRMHRKNNSAVGRTECPTHVLH